MEIHTHSDSVSVRFENISKSFGSVTANHNVTMEVKKGEILALLGENGSGKTTLMNMLSGIYYPDSGKIYVNGEEAIIRSPKDAFCYHIGMIHQHFKLIDIFTSLENIILGLKPNVTFSQKLRYFWKKKSPGVKRPLNCASKRDARKMVRSICGKYGFFLGLDKKVYDMSVSEKQTLEIVKALYRGADILVLDEPTAVLTPLETEKLFSVLRNMRADGKTVIIITHKLNEVMEISDRVAVLRKGSFIGVVNTKDTNEKELTNMMVGKPITLNITRSEPKDCRDRLMVKNVCCRNEYGMEVLHDISFTAKSGEIFGIAGISGSGQKEILDSIAGLIRDDSGTILYADPKKNDQLVNLMDHTPAQIREMGVRLSFVPEDRLGMGLVGNMDVVDNMMLRSYRKSKFGFVDRKRPTKVANAVIDELEVNTPSIHTSVRKLSGGNVQKILVGREITASPKVLMVAYPVRGLDINSSYTIYHLLDEQKRKGVCIIYVGEDLDVMLALCDRIAVVAGGKISGVVDARKSNKSEIGLLMTTGTEKEFDYGE